jgi:hypothetical protein
MFSTKNTSAGINIRFMGSTFWAELYFRSLKRARVLSLLTKYLLRYKKVCIPNVGTFEIVMQSPQLNVAEKLISSPIFIIQHRTYGEVTDHQFHFFTSQGIQENCREELFSFGERMKKRIQNSPFYWKGLGTLRYDSNEMLFEPDEMKLESLQAAPAQKVLRENVQHQVLVGDQEMTSQQVTDVLNTAEYKRPWFIIAGWILLILAVVTILIYLYRNNFETASTGLKHLW